MSRIGVPPQGLFFGPAVTKTDPKKKPFDMTCYYEPHRKYHTYTHISEMLSLYGTHFQGNTVLSETQHGSLVLAILYHDAVYNPRERDNEERSAALARQEMELREIDEQMIVDTERLILSTKTHDPTSMDERILSDLDLAILGADHERYKKYVGQVREEYDFVPDEIWASERGRPSVLKSFLDRSRIFYYLTDREQQARNNLAWELMQYEGHP